MNFSSAPSQRYWQAIAQRISADFAAEMASSAISESDDHDNLDGLPLWASSSPTNLPSFTLTELLARLLVEQSLGNTALPLAALGEPCRVRPSLSALSGIADWQVTEALPAIPIICYQDKLALHRHVDGEWQIARAIANRFAASREELSTEQAYPAHLSAAQKAAVRAANQQALTLISGGPGTGKTTIVATVIQQCLARGIAAEKIALSAPTGKAVQRLQESLTRASIEAHGLTFATLHRLLGLFPADFAIRQTPSHVRLPYRLIIVDEASMLDLRLLQTLLALAPDDAQLILLGDHYQLGPIGLGQPFADIHHVLAATPMVQHLSASYRFNPHSTIGQLARQALECDTAQPMIDTLQAVNAWHEPATLSTVLKRAFATYHQMTREAELLPLDLLTESKRVKVLTSHNLGTLGCDAINAAIDRWMRPTDSSAAGYYPGQVLMMTHNDSVNQLYNGDTGVCWISDGLPYLITDTAGDTAKGYRQIPLLALSGLVSAYAITIHKSQGSEYDQVFISISSPPPRPDRSAEEPTLLSRALLYTALTRAKQEVALIAEPAALDQCLTSYARETLLSSLLPAAIAVSSQTTPFAQKL